MAGTPSTVLFMDASQPAPLSAADVSLEVVDGPEQGRRLGPLTPPVRVGSGRGNDVVLADGTVSRFHCTLERRTEGLAVRDAGSLNGTWVSGVRVNDAWVTAGTVLRLGQTSLMVRVQTGGPRALSSEPRFGDLLGQSIAMRELFTMLGRLAAVDTAVLILGETGTGKELVARALHSRSPRARSPFVVVDCGAVAPSLIESELFGHTRGAFTGADAHRVGAFEAASGGTLFLDEVGELPLALQPKLLRALESGVVRPLGSTREVSVNLRVVAATHRDLGRMVNEGTFREDLYYRLAVCPVCLPPLRERPDDVALLGRHFLARFLHGPGALAESAPPLTPETEALLTAQPWPGNVRALRNAIERAVVLGAPERIGAGDLAAALRQVGPTGARADAVVRSLEDAKAAFEREYLLKLMARHGADLDAAAREADLHPKSLARLLRRYELPRG